MARITEKITFVVDSFEEANSLFFLFFVVKAGLLQLSAGQQIIGRLGLDGTAMFNTQLEVFTFSLGMNGFEFKADMCHLLGLFMGKER